MKESPIEHSVVATRFSAMYVGEVPPPDILDAYERHSPGAADRFISIVEMEQKNRFELVKRSMDFREREEENETRNFRFGLCASTFVMVLLFIFMGICAFLRLESALIAALGVPLVGSIGSVIAQFLWRKKR